MPTLNKLEYLDETKHQIKEALNTNFDSQIQDDDTFRSYVSKISDIYTNWPKVEGEDTSLNLTPTKKGLMNLSLKGNTSQDTTTGKNLLNMSIKGQVPSVNTGALVNYGGGATTELMEIDNTKNYCFSFIVKSETISTQYVFFYDVNEDYLGYVSGVSNGYLLANSNYFSSAKYIRVRLDVINDYSNIMLEQGSTATSYEPYTNGASPNPDYPQQIHVVTGDNSIKINNGNLLPQDKYVASTTINGITYTNNGDGTFSLSGTASANTTFVIIPYDEINLEVNQPYYLYSSQAYDATTFNMSIPMIDNGSTKFILANGTYTPTTTPTNVRLQFYLASGNSVNAQNVKLMLVEGTTAPNNYVPYQTPQIYPVNLGTTELCNIPNTNYEDGFVRNSGKNLFDVSTITENTYIEDNGNTGGSQVTNLSDYIEVKPNTKYTLSYDYSTLLNQNQRNFVFYDENKTYISGYIYLPINKTNTITTPSNAKYLRFSYDKSCNQIQLELGDTATSYEPYGTNEWYLKKEINKITLNGSNYPLYGDGGSSTDYWEYSRTGMTGGIGSQASVITNYFNQTTNSRIVILSNGGMYFRFPKNAGIDVSTNTLLNTWLSTHNTDVYYVLAIPTYTKIEGTLKDQLEVVWRTNSYDTQTNISQTNYDLGFIISTSALMKGGN